MWAAAPWKMQANKNSFPKQAGATSVPCSLHGPLTSWFGFGFTFIDGWKKERKRHDSFDYKCHGHKDGAVQSNDTFFFFTEYLCALITAGHVLECVWELSVWTVVHFCTCIRLNRLFFFHLGLITPHMRIKIATSRFFSDPIFEAHLSAHAYVPMFFFFFALFLQSRACMWRLYVYDQWTLYLCKCASFTRMSLLPHCQSSRKQRRLSVSTCRIWAFVRQCWQTLIQSTHVGATAITAHRMMQYKDAALLWGSKRIFF